MGVNRAPQSREPGITLEVLAARVRALPKSVELELALADFMELPVHEQMELLFLGLVHTSGSADWAVDRLKELLK